MLIPVDWFSESNHLNPIYVIRSCFIACKSLFDFISFSPSPFSLYLWLFRSARFPPAICAPNVNTFFGCFAFGAFQLTLNTLHSLEEKVCFHSNINSPGRKLFLCKFGETFSVLKDKYTKQNRNRFIRYKRNK